MIIGAMKAGTTALATYLQYHPSLYLSRLKEPYFFNPRCGRKCPPGGHHWNLRYYFSLFPNFPSAPARWAAAVDTALQPAWLPRVGELRAFEASPSYLFTSPATAQLVADWMLPSAAFEQPIRGGRQGGKFIVMVRDPVDRAYSQYQLGLTLRQTMGGGRGGCNDDLTTRGFSTMAALAVRRMKPCAKILGAWNSNTEQNKTADAAYYTCKRDKQPTDKCGQVVTASSMLSPGLYYYHIKRWVAAVGRHNIHIVVNEELATQPIQTLQVIFEFLGMPASSNGVTESVIKELRQQPALLSKLCPTFFGIQSQKVFNPELLFGQGSNRSRTPLEAMLGGAELDRVSTSNCGGGMGGADQQSEGEPRYPPMEHTTRAKLAAFFAPHNRRLFKLLGRNLNWTAG